MIHSGLRAKLQHPAQLALFDQQVRGYKDQVMAILEEVRVVIDRANTAGCIDERLLLKWVKSRQNEDDISLLQTGLVYKAYQLQRLPGGFMKAWLQEKKPKGRPNVWREMVFRYVQEHEGGSGDGPSAALVLDALKQARK